MFLAAGVGLWSPGASLVATTFGMMNLFARALGGVASDGCPRVNRASQPAQ
jgi:hypothetical protein